MSLDKVRKKLEEARTIEERRLIVEELRDRRSRLWELYKMVLGFAIGAVSSDGILSLVTLAALRSVREVVIVIGIVTLMLYVSLYVLYMLENEIRLIDNILLDPAMPRRATLALYITLLIAGTVFTIISILTILGIV